MASSEAVRASAAEVIRARLTVGPARMAVFTTAPARADRSSGTPATVPTTAADMTVPMPPDRTIRPSSTVGVDPVRSPALPMRKRPVAMTASPATATVRTPWRATTRPAKKATARSVAL